MQPVILVAGVLAVLLPLAQAEAPFAAPGPVIARTLEDRLTVGAPKAGRARPLVVVVAGAGGAETTDFVIPYGVLKDSGVADVRGLSTVAGSVTLWGALKVLADQTVAAFDAAEPAGADIVIVPAQMSPKDAQLKLWIQAQAAKGATIVSVCEGARVLANAGLLDGKRAASHWSSLKDLRKAYPSVTWVRDRRYVQDGAIISTTGVSASIPMSLALVEAIGGHETARATAQRLGVDDWSAIHRTADFRVSRADYARAALSLASVWSHEQVETPIVDGVDEVALALRADAWQRTYRTKVLLTHPGGGQVVSRHGLTILATAEPKPGRYVIPAGSAPAARQLDAALADMGHRYGPLAVRLATLGLEYDPPKRP